MPVPSPALRTVNWCKQAGHFIVIPEGGMRLSSRSYWALQRSQEIFMVLRGRNHTMLTTLAAARIGFTTRIYLAKETIRFRVGGVAERFKAAVLKTAGRKSRGFESLLLR